MVHSFFAAASKYKKNIYPRQWFEQTQDIEFESHIFKIFSSYDQLLTTVYGDYMTPSSSEERKRKVHAAIIDLEKPYTEYLEAQRNMKFDEYCRSIR